MKLAYVMTDGRGETDRLLSNCAERLMAQGIALAGVVQTNTEVSDSHLCDMDVSILPDGPCIRISQSLGAGARGCRLNPEALEQAVAGVSAALTDGQPQLVIVNKFGKHEAGGRGFRPVIAEALARDIPVLVGVNGGNLDAFVDFSGGVAEQVSATGGSGTDTLDHWLAGIGLTMQRPAESA